LQPAFERFQGHADRYAGFRPDYPEQLLKALSHSVLRDPPAAGGVVADVGSGTGIFTRQLRALLPAGLAVVGIEPASDMRLKAAAMSALPAGIRYLDGLAQELPLETGRVRAVVAATAAHWFDRPEFYKEAHRVLVPSGILAIVEYVRDHEGSPAAAAVVDFLARHGGPRAYARPDYAAELRHATGFRDFEHTIEAVTLRLSREAFVGLALSSSHARAAVDALGEREAERTLLQMVETLVSSDGAIPYGYVFHLFTVRRQ
jgi:SAM-dependent methyltransferase